MEIVYIDSLFFLNLAIDYLLLLATGKICALPLRRARMALGALWGAAYAVLAVLRPGLFALAAVKLLAGAALPLIAFGAGGKKRAPRAVVVFFAVSAAFGGAVYAACSLAGVSLTRGVYIPVSLKVLVLSFALCYAAFSLVFRRAGRRGERMLRKVSVTLAGRTAEFTALLDTGNELTDPVTGEGVLVAEAEALAPLLGESAALLRADPLESFTALAESPFLRGRLRLLPCSSATGGDGLLLCFRPDALRVDGRRARASVAVARTALSPDGEYQGLVSE